MNTSPAHHLPRSLTLCGPPGAGKSTVAPLVAEALGLPWVDLDARIAAAAGCSVAELFAREGEAGFRRRETAALAEVGPSPGVLSCGGGVLLADENRALLAARGPVIGLTAGLETLAARLEAAPADPRPLLAGGRHALARLLAERQPLYDALPWQVDTEGRGPAEVAAAVVALHRALGTDAAWTGARSLPVAAPPQPAEAQGSRFGYGYLLGPGLLDGAGAILAARGLGRLVAVADRRVAALHGKRLARSFAGAGLEPPRWIRVTATERRKSPAGLAALYRAFQAAGLDREGTVLALGGGVIGDLAGYAAATWLRGVTLVQAPSSLLAMVDAGLGGKTGIDLPAGKNLLGAFKHPALVLADLSCLATLPPAQVAEGLAELVKAALIADPTLLDLLAEGAPPTTDAAAWGRLVARGVAVKAAIVGADPGERSGRRLHLNLGHTFAHGLEQASGYRISHGRAVALGLVAAARLSGRLGLLQRPSLPDELSRLLARLGLPTRLADLGELAELRELGEPSKPDEPGEPRELGEPGEPGDLGEQGEQGEPGELSRPGGPASGPPPDLAALKRAAQAAMARDKKVRAGRLRLVLPVAPGEVRVVEGISADEAVAALE